MHHWPPVVATDMRSTTAAPMLIAVAKHSRETSDQLAASVRSWSSEASQHANCARLVSTSLSRPYTRTVVDASTTQG